MVLALSLAAPLQASCGTFAQITNIDGTGATSFLVNTAFQNFGGDPGTYYGTGAYGPYNFSFDPANPANTPLSPAAQITFWRTGTGDPAVGMGDDNGTYDMIANGGFYFSGTLPTSTFGGYIRGGKLLGTWQPAGIDGCVGANSCMCLLVTDQDGVNGDWAILGAMSNANFNSFMDIGGTDGVANLAPIRMVNFDPPGITGSRRDAVSFDVELDVTLAAPAGGVYTQDGCACGPVGFKVLQQIVPEGNMPPTDRDAGLWAEPTLVGGGAQGVTAFGDTVTVESACGASNTDVYLTTQLIFDSNFGTSVVSGNSTRVECGPTLANPDDRPSKPARPQRDRPSRRR